MDSLQTALSIVSILLDCMVLIMCANTIRYITKTRRR